MVRILAALALIAAGAAMCGADTWDDWHIQIGVGGNDPYGNDYYAVAGVHPDAEPGFDPMDVVHPPLDDPDNDLGFFFEGYDYPPDGLTVDLRAPYAMGCDMWTILVHAPREGEAYDLRFILPDLPWVSAEILAVMDAPDDLGNLPQWDEQYGLVLSDFGPGEHVLTGLVQWGPDRDHEWLLTMCVPEPAGASLFGAAGIAALALLRRRAR